MRAGDAAIGARLGVSEAEDVLLSHASASAIEAVCLLMIDSLDLETLMQMIPRRRVVGTQNRSLRDADAND